MKQKNKNREILDATRVSDIFKLMVKRKLARVRDLLNDQAALDYLCISAEELAFLRAHRRLSREGLQHRLWERPKGEPLREWVPPGGHRISDNAWQFNTCAGCGDWKRVYRRNPKDSYLCRECRLLTQPETKEVFCSNPNCLRAAPNGLIKGRCRACDSYFRRNETERTFGPDGRTIITRSPEHRASISASLRGWKPTSETLAAMSEAARERGTPSQKTRDKISTTLRRLGIHPPRGIHPRGMLGKKHSTETRTKMRAASAAGKAKKKEWRAKLSADLEARWVKKKRLNNSGAMPIPDLSTQTSPTPD